MRSKKLYIVLIIVLVLFFLIIFLSFGVKNIAQENYQATIIVGDSSVWNYQKKKWVNITRSDSLQELNWKKFVVYQNNQRLGEYFLWKDEEWYLFDQDNNAVPFEGNLLAYDANYDLNITPFVEDNQMDSRYVNSVLVERNINLDNEFTGTSHVSFDFDSDGVAEDFYIVTNAFAMDFEPEVSFSLVFMVKNEEITMLYDSVLVGNNYNICKPYFYSFLDVNHDHTYEMILSCGRYSIDGQIDMLYQFQDGAFKIVISNE